MEVANHSYSKENAVESLQKLINSWLEENPNRSVAMLAKNSNVGENCIRRILNSNSMPTTANLHKILSFLNPNSTNMMIKNRLAKDLSQHLAFTLSYLFFEEFNNFKPMLEKESILKDFPHQFIFERSSIASGITIAEIISLFGSYGSTVVDNLVKNELVTVSDDIVVCQPEYKLHSWSVELYKSFSANVISNFYKTNSSINYLYNVNEGVSVAGYSKVMDILEAASKQITKTIQENAGDIPLSTVCFMDTMTNINLFESKNEAT
ncbi:MAG: hypothetical protein ACK41T_02330 [Pseudobdellovibrio sp.]